ncbi:MAG: Flp family type IVb pilin [Clostridia bacterium]|nr:Flp family type IVb pilin [Clostridia bacterium]
MFKAVKGFVSDERGQGMAEYGLIIALVAVGCIAALALLGPAIARKFGSVTTELDSVS